MDKKICFIGHRWAIPICVGELLYGIIEREIICGYSRFLVGTHGAFDESVLRTLKQLRQKYKEIRIEVVITSLNDLRSSKYIGEGSVRYEDVETIFYPIEEEYFKRKIIVSNQYMVSDSDTLICYVDPARKPSGAFRVLNYAMKKGLRIINLYDLNRKKDK